MKKESFKIFLKATRLNKPIPILFLIFPSICALIMLSKTNVPDIGLLLVVIIGATCARTMGCMINDILDSSIDTRVKRTKNRSFASGDVSGVYFYTVLSIFTIASFLCLLTLSTKSIIIGLVIFLLISIYPLTKRFFFLPQVFLATVYNSGIIIVSIESVGTLNAPASLFYIGCAFWTFGYDTLYSIQDIDCDKKLKLHSSSIFFKNPVDVVDNVYDLSVLFWLSAGGLAKLGYSYYLLMGVVWILLKKQTRNIDKDDVDSYQTAFESNVMVIISVTLSIFVGKIIV